MILKKRVKRTCSTSQLKLIKVLENKNLLTFFVYALFVKINQNYYCIFLSLFLSLVSSMAQSFCKLIIIITRFSENSFYFHFFALIFIYTIFIGTGFFILIVKLYNDLKTHKFLRKKIYTKCSEV